MSRLALVQPQKRISNAYTGHLGIQHIAAYVKSAGHDVRIVDRNIRNNRLCISHNGDLSNVVSEVADFNPDFVGVTVWDYGGIEAAELIPQLREKLKDSVYVVGGPEVTVSPETTLVNTGADFAVRGEGTHAFLAITDGKLNSPGISYFDGGEFVGSAPAPYDINNWKLDPSLIQSTQSRFYWIVSSVGCNYGGCGYCNVGNIFPKIEFMDLDLFVGNMAEVLTGRKVGYFNLADDNLLASPRRILDIHNVMTQKGIDQQIAFMARADGVIHSRDYLEVAVDRVLRVDLGIESFLDSQLQRMKKGTTAKQNHEAISTLKDIGIMPRFFLILADIDTDIDELMEVTNVFREHPEYLSLIARVNIMQYRDERDSQYPNYVKLFRSFFEVVANNNNSSAISDTHEAYLYGMNVATHKRKVISDILDEFDSVIERLKQGVVSTEDAKGVLINQSRALIAHVSRLY